MARAAKRLRFTVGGERTNALLYRAASPTGATLILAPGAGAPQSHPFLTRFAAGVAARGVEVATFDFLYAAAGRRAPDRAPRLEACYRAALSSLPRAAGWSGPPAIGGKSMGGRIATHLAADGAEVRAVVAIGYPLTPPGGAPRVLHLPRVRVPLLVLQGTRDDFGGPDDLRPHLTGLDATVVAVAGADHSFKVLKRGYPPQAEVEEVLHETVARWLIDHL